MIDKNRTDKIKEKSKIVRKNIVEMIGFDKTGHLGGSCSCADIVSALYFDKMKYNPKNPKEENRDRFLLSKGHAALAQYAALIELGVIPKEEIHNLKKLGSIMQGHPDINKTPGIEANTGSLGQGLSIGCGMAMGLKLNKSNNRVYVVLGDAELAEGQIWEATMAAANFKLDNLVAIADINGFGASGALCEGFPMLNVSEKFKAFGWHVLEIDGHDIEKICTAFDTADTIKDKPVVIVAKTVKGKSILFAENVASFHHGAMKKEQYYQALKDIEKIS